MKQQNQREQRQCVFAGICLLFFLLVSNVPVGAQTVIPFAEGVNTKKEMKLSEIASKVQYITLEMTSESILDKDILNATFAGGYLFVSDYKNLFQFTPEGKFIRKIAQAGQGPGEYNQSMLAVAYDEPGKQIFISDMRNGKVLVYSFEGKFLREIKQAAGGLTPLVDAEGNLYCVSNNYLYSKDRTGKELFVYNKAGKLIHSFPFHFETGKRYPGVIFQYANLYSYKGNVYYQNPLETIIYRLDGKKKIPVYKLDLLKYEKLTTEEDKVLIDTKNAVGSARPIENKFYFRLIMETDANVGVSYFHENESRFAWYDKHTGKVCRIRGRIATWDGFVDDLEEGTPFFPSYYNGGKMINLIPASVLLERVKPSAAKGSLKKVMTNLLEDDNPILQVVTLK